MRIHKLRSFFSQNDQVRAGLSEGAIDLLRKTNLVSEAVGEDESCPSCESFVGVFELQHLLDTLFVVRGSWLSPNG